MEFIKRFKREQDWQKRLVLSQSLRQKHPSRLPLIVDRFNLTLPPLKKHKFLVPDDFCVGQLLVVLRRHFTVTDSSQAVFLFVGKEGIFYHLPPVAESLMGLYRRYQDRDGFLYVVLSSESTFGEKQEELKSL